MKTKSKLRRRSLLSFSVFFLVAFFLMQVWAWVSHSAQGEFIAPVFRTILESNGRIWHSLFDETHQAPTFKPREKGARARVNGDIGLLSPLNLANWKLEIIVNADDEKPRHLWITMDEIRQLPRVDSTIEFKCIEGWSQIISYTGVRFSDFLRHYKLGSHRPQAWEDGKIPSSRFLYVGLRTPDGEYYVSNDMESMLHPQTLLAYEMNGEALSIEHGAPLRLIIPVKYGIKSLKRIGQIFFSDQRPPDYWAEQGYDWFSGL